MKTRPIGFFDSGVGGLSVLKHALSVMPEENYIYFGDSLNAPYGTKTAEEVYSLTEKGIDFLVKSGVKAIVVACNTATSIAVDRLREKIDIPIISMEPAIKPALEQTDGKVLLLATKATVSSKRVNALIDRYDNNNRVIKLACHELAKKIEQAVFENADIDSYLNELLLPYLDKNVTAVVLGCTHYPFVKDKMSKILNQNVVFFDGIDGTVAHLKDILEKNEIKNCSKSKGCVKIISSAKDPDAIMLYNKLLNGGIL
jgi:glutamate racemase